MSVKFSVRAMFFGLMMVAVLSAAMPAAAADIRYDTASHQLAVFPQEDEAIEVWGMCVEDECQLVARVDVTALQAVENYSQRFEVNEGSGWFAEVSYVGASERGYDWYRLDLYIGNTVVDSNLRVEINTEDGVWDLWEVDAEQPLFSDDL